MEKNKQMASFPCRSRKELRIYSWYSLPDLKDDQKRFIRIPSLDVQEMGHLNTFYLILSNGYHGNDDRYNNVDFGFSYVFASSMTVQSSVTISSDRTKVINDQNFQIFVSDHLNKEKKPNFHSCLTFRLVFLFVMKAAVY